MWVGSRSLVFYLAICFVSFGNIGCQKKEEAEESAPLERPPLEGNHTGSQINGQSIDHSTSPLGANVEPFNAWTPTSIFTDVFPKSRPWVSNICDQSGWETGPALELDANGWVKNLVENQCADTFLYTANKETYPWGTFVLMWEGEGSVTISGDVGIPVVVETSTLTKNANGLYRMEFAVGEGNRTDGGIIVRLSDITSDYIRNMRMIPPGGVCGQSETDFDPFTFCKSTRGGYGTCSAEQTCIDFESVYWDRFIDSTESMSTKLVFHPEWVRNYRPFRALRFMKWTREEDSTRSNWTDRILPQAQAFTTDENGIPYEYVIAMSNLLETDVWINIPMKASDDYASKMAKFFLEKLNTTSSISLEYGNENFNGLQAVPYSFALEKANEAGSGIPSTDADLTKVAKYSATRAAYLFDIWDTDFAASKSRLIRILGGWASQLSFAKDALSFGSLGTSFDAIAISGYFGPDRRFFDNTAEFDSMSVDQIFDNIYGEEAIEYSQKSLVVQYSGHKALANDYGIRMVAYEGGSHVIASDAPSDTVYRMFLAHRDERMGIALYENLAKWKLSGGDVFFHFLVYDMWNENGFFGAFEFQGQSRESSYKWEHLNRFADENPCWWPGCEQ